MSASDLECLQRQCASAAVYCIYQSDCNNDTCKRSSAKGGGSCDFCYGSPRTVQNNCAQSGGDVGSGQNGNCTKGRQTPNPAIELCATNLADNDSECSHGSAHFGNGKSQYVGEILHELEHLCGFDCSDAGCNGIMARCILETDGAF